MFTMVTEDTSKFERAGCVSNAASDVKDEVQNGLEDPFVLSQAGQLDASEHSQQSVDGQSEQPIALLRSAREVQRAAPAPLSSLSAASTARDAGWAEGESSEQIDKMPSEQQVGKFLERKESDAPPEPISRRLTPAGSIEHLIRNYESHGKAGTLRSDISETHSEVLSANSLPKVLSARSPSTRRLSEDEAVPSMQDASGVSGGVVKERRERVEQLIKRSKELAQETSQTLSREKMRTPTNKFGSSASTRHNSMDTKIASSTTALRSNSTAQNTVQPQPSDYDILEPKDTTVAALTTVNLNDSFRPSIASLKSSPSATRGAPPPATLAAEAAAQHNRDLNSPTKPSSTTVVQSSPNIVSITPRSLATSTSKYATSLPMKSPNVKSIDELRARHAQFKGTNSCFPHSRNASRVMSS